MYLKADSSKCTGCGYCLLACSSAKHNVFNPRRVRLRLEQDIKHGKIEVFVCDACGDCVEVCPEEAIVVDENKVKIVNENCTLCGLCVDACPINIIHLEEERAQICDFCKECVEMCPFGVIEVV